MKNITIIVFLLNSACASFANPPELTLRKLEISQDKPSLEYDYEVCIKKFIGICTKKEMKREYYDLTNPEVRKTLIDAGFIAVVRDKPI